MVQATDKGKRNNMTQPRRINNMGFGRIFIQRQVGSAGMVVTNVLAKDPAQVQLVENDLMIQTITADGTNQAFNEWILPRLARRRDNILHTQALDPSSNGLTIDAISVSQQITQGCIKRKCLYELLGCPLSGGMRRHIEAHYSATIMAGDNEHIENAKCGSGDGNEINRG